MRADAAVLVDHGAAAEDDMVVDGDVPGQCHHVRQDGMTADLGIMRKMNIRHDPVVISDPGHADVLNGAGVEGAEFSYDVVIADFQASRFACVLLVLRVATADGMRVDAIVATDAGVPGNDGL